MMNAEEAAAAKEEGVQSPIKKKSQIEGIDSNDRLKWGPELHEHFLQAVYRLGGPFATKVGHWEGIYRDDVLDSQIGAF